MNPRLAERSLQEYVFHKPIILKTYSFPQRGGAGNIGAPGVKPQHHRKEDVVPEQAIRESSEDETHHFGVWRSTPVEFLN